MRPGEETRTGMRIAWLLFSLSFLLHSVYPTDVTGSPATTMSADRIDRSSSGADPMGKTTPNPTSATNVAGAGATQAPTQPRTTVAGGGTTLNNPTDSLPTQAPVLRTLRPSSLPTDPITIAPAVVTTVATTPPTTTTKTTNPAATPTTIKKTTSAAMSPAADSSSSSSSSSSGSVVVATSSVSSQTQKASAPTEISISGTLTSNPHHVGTSKTTKVSADPTAKHQIPMTSATISSQTTKGDSEKTTVMVRSNGPTAPAVPESMGTTSSPGTPTRAGSPTPDNLSGTGTGSLQITTTATTTTTTIVTTAESQPKKFHYSLNGRHEKDKDKELLEVCKRLMANLVEGNCTMTWRRLNGKVQFDHVEINGKAKTSLAAQYYEEISKEVSGNKTLIAILASCGALLIMIVILAVCASHHRKPYHENQQHLTEELHTVENGYHDNPTLEVMEVQPEMQEKKMALNGEFNDSWIVPIDNLLKDDVPDEEDTHL